MKILCIGRNYLDHAKELNNPVPSQPMVFLKPPTALLRNDGPFPYPSFSGDVHYEVELILRISQICKNLSELDAHAAWDAIGVGIDFTARDVQDRLKKSGHPWEIAKGFDHSAPVSQWIPRREIPNEASIRFTLTKNQEMVQLGDSAELIFPFARLISHLSQYFTLEPGDIVFTGTPAGVGPVQPGDMLEATLESRPLLRCKVV